MFPKISIIIPTFNSKETLPACLDSCISQTYSSLEIIIIDNESTDGTLTIIKKYQSIHSFIHYISEKDNGIYDAMNKGIDIAKGDFLLFLGSDDRLYNSEVLNNIFNKSKLFEKHDVIYGNVSLNGTEDIYGGKFTSYRLLHWNICHQAIFTRKEVFNKLNKFETQYKIYADYAFNMKWFNNKTIKHNYINITVSMFSQGGYSYNNIDCAFDKDKSLLQKKFFPFLIVFLYRNKSKIVIKQLVHLIYGY